MVAGIDISFWKAHKFLSNEKKYIKILIIFGLVWKIKSQQKLIWTLSHDFLAIQHVLGNSFYLWKKADKIHSNKYAQIFPVYCGISQVGPDSRKILVGKRSSCCARHLPAKTESSYVPEKAVIHFCDKMGAVNKRCQWKKSLDSNRYMEKVLLLWEHELRRSMAMKSALS